jgi:hypothetical protein
MEVDRRYSENIETHRKGWGINLEYNFITSAEYNFVCR